METDPRHRPRVELMLPIVMDPAGHEALLVFGPKRSQEPYTREDLDSLAAIASSLALLLEGPTPVPDRLEQCLRGMPAVRVMLRLRVSLCANEQA